MSKMSSMVCSKSISMQLIDCALVKVRMKAMVNVTTTMMGHFQVDTYEGDYYMRRYEDSEKRRVEQS